MKPFNNIKEIDNPQADKAILAVKSALDPNTISNPITNIGSDLFQSMITSLLSGADLSVTSLGKNIDSDTTEKHQIKRSTRLCSNIHLHQEISGIYSALCRSRDLVFFNLDKGKIEAL